MNKSTIIQELTLEKNTLFAIVKKVDKRLCKAPDGTIRIIRHRKGYQYYLRMNGADKSGVYLPVAERGKAEALIQKGYDLKIKKAAQRQYSVLQRFLKNYRPDELKEIYANLSEVKRKTVIPVEISDAEYIRQWQSYKYESKMISEDVPEHYTSLGERVRSKSEVMIADTLKQENIPYRYECPLSLGGKTVYPDFTILRTGDRETIYWEHLGMMDNPEYVQSALRKVRMYEEQGIYPGIRLILTMEIGFIPINITVIRRMIRMYCI